tara:strand:- start:3951 stop:4598 length:648 start_codon:yes stop_codon:yes gene_type:complete
MGIDANLAGVHPILDFRIRGLLSEPKLKRYGTYPAVREYSKQKSMYDRYKAGTFPNLVANPDRVLRTGPAFPYSWKPRGSWHMKQGPEGYGHAVDIRRPLGVTRSMADRAIKPYLAKWGLKQTVRSEFWHLQALTSQGWVDGPSPSGDSEMFITYDTDRDEHIVHVAGVGSAVVTAPAHWQEVISKGRMSGEYASPHMNALWDAMKKQKRRARVF